MYLWDYRLALANGSSLQTIFADNTYSKPFFLTYVNTSFFILPLFTILFSRLWGLWRAGKLSQIKSFRSLLNHLDSPDPKAEERRILEDAQVYNGEDTEDELDGDDSSYRRLRASNSESSRLGLRATAKLSFEFCMLWVCESL